MDLPDELLLCILRRIPGEGVARMARVCKQWRRVCRDTHAFSHLTLVEHTPARLVGAMVAAAPCTIGLRALRVAHSDKYMKGHGDGDTWRGVRYSMHQTYHSLTKGARESVDLVREQDAAMRSMAPRLRELEVGGWHQISAEILVRAPGCWPHLTLLRVRNAHCERARTVGLAIARMRALERFEFFAREEGDDNANEQTLVDMCLKDPPATLRTITLDLRSEAGASSFAPLAAPFLEALSVVAPRMLQSPLAGVPLGAYKRLRELRVRTAALKWDDVIEIAFACPALEAYELHLCVDVDEGDDTAVVAGTIVRQWGGARVMLAETLERLRKEMERRLPRAHPASATLTPSGTKEAVVVLAAGELRELRRSGHFEG